MIKKILHINSMNYGSTGNIMLSISEIANNKGFISYTSCPAMRTTKKIKSTKNIFIGNILSRNIHIILNLFTGYNGCFSYLSTYRFLKRIDRINFDLIHLHNLHNCYINLPMLFNYIKKKDIPVIWTLHDCWSFTGQCPHFDFIKCEKWKTGCSICPQFREYPASRVDRTDKMYRLKKSWFTGIKNMTIITPSEWLASHVKQSFLNIYPIRVINNGINLSIFKPISSNFREKYNISDKFIILGVASPWSNKKGLDIFYKLSQLLDKRFQIILVGLNQEEMKKKPLKILGLERITDKHQLAEIYTTVDIFLNPTYEDTFPTTNIEALACGTSVITFNTGGSVESIDNTCGIVVEKDDIAGLIDKIHLLYNTNFSSQNCINRAINYNEEMRFNEYMELYNEIFGRKKEVIKEA